MNLKIRTFGWNENPTTSQMPRINKAFEEVGCQLVTDEPCFATYCHDSSQYDLAINYKEKYPDTILLLKVLDIPEHIFPNFDLQGLKNKLLKADKILANSNTVKKQIKKYLDLDSKVVLDIPKPIINLNISFKDKYYRFTSFGRLADRNKRGHLIHQLEEYTDERVVTAGPEWAGNQNHLGMINDDNLNQVYNNSCFVLCLGKIEGICLPIIESFMAGSFPLVASDMTTANEFCPPEFHVEPNVVAIANKADDITKNYNHYKNIADKWAESLLPKFHPHQIIRNILAATNPF